MTDEPVVRTFETGANRDVDTDKLDFEGFLSPAVITRFGEYMHKNRHLRDGSIRDSDNWQKGIPRDVYVKSMFRHFVAVWRLHRGLPRAEGVDMEEALCALLFNVQGLLHETLKARAEFEAVTHADAPREADVPPSFVSHTGVDVPDKQPSYSHVDNGFGEHTLVWQSDINRG